LLANDDTAGGKSCILADDFTVPAGEIWTIDTIRIYMFWYKKAPDSIRIILYPDADVGGFPNDVKIIKSFTVKANMPQALTLYTIKVNAVSQNIVLPEATYWLSALGVHNTGTMAKDTCLTLWNRKDTMLGTYTAQCMDSIGAHYEPYPTPWLGIIFSGENQANSARFALKGTRAVAINTSNKPKSRVSSFAYPNPASDNITFDINNPAVRYIQLYDMKGKLLQTVSAKTNRKKVHLNALTNGIYMYQLLDASRKSVDRGRFSVSK
jgi:hypothetical protein